MTPKPDYKKLYAACQDGCNRLRIERDAAEKRYQEMVVKAEMPKSHIHDAEHCDACNKVRGNPVVQPHISEKIVEKKVLPWWAGILLYICLGAWIYMAILVFHQLWIQYAPIYEPYPVYITKVNTEDLTICKDAWRENERTIRQLKRRLR
jgi:hypothetical protein